MSDNRTFIVLDGPDFSGKSTLMEAFLKRVEAEGIDHLAMREPGFQSGVPSLAEEIREILLSHREEVVHPETDILMHMAYRVQNVKNNIIPALASGKWVISDRFIFSTYALNCQAHLPTHPHLTDMMYGLMPTVLKGIPEPLTFILDTPRNIRDQRAASDIRKKDRYESQPKDVLDRIDEAYNQLKSMPSCKFINGTLPIDEQVDIMFATIKAFKEDIQGRIEEAVERTGVMDDDRAQAINMAEQIKAELDSDESWDLEEQVSAYVKSNVTEMVDQLFQGASEEQISDQLVFAEKFARDMALTVFERTNQDRTIFHPSRVGQINQKVHSMLSWGFSRDMWANHFSNGGDNAEKTRQE